MEIILVCNDRTLNGNIDVAIPANIKVSWLHEPVPGSAFARNFGLRHASGEWIQFLDVDDLLLPGKIGHQLLHVTNGAVVSPHTYQYLNGTMEKYKWISGDVWEGLLNSGLGSTSSMLWNREALLNAGGWSTKYQSHQEYELLFRLLMSGKEIICATENETIVRARKSGSITQLTKQTRAKEGIQLREEIWSYMLQKNLDTPSRKNAFLQYMFRQLRGVMTIDPSSAKNIYEKHFEEENFAPSGIGIPFYKTFYKLLGFAKTEA